MREPKKIKGRKNLAYEIANHPLYLKLGKRSMKKLAKKIASDKK